MSNNPFSKFMKNSKNPGARKLKGNINEINIDEDEDFDFEFEENKKAVNSNKKEVNQNKKIANLNVNRNNDKPKDKYKERAKNSLNDGNRKFQNKNQNQNQNKNQNKNQNEKQVTNQKYVPENKVFLDKKILESLKEFERKAPCKYYKNCGGCNLQEITYEGQLSYKQKIVEEIFSKNKVLINPIIGAQDEFRYRNKIISTFTFDRKEIKAGIYKEGSHKIVPIAKCLIEDQIGYEIVNNIKKMMPGFKMMPYDEDSEYGFLRHVLIRKGLRTNEVLLCLVVSSKVFPGKNNFIKAIRKLHPEISTIILNINDKKTSAVLGQTNITIFGKGTIRDILMDKKFEISASSFYQVNPIQTEKLYSKAIELANLQKDEVLLDAYSGIGTISIIASEHVDEVISVELNREAHLNAIKNAHLNDVKNVKFVNMDATEYMIEAAARNEKIDVVIMDPPRSGSTKEFMDAIEKIKAKKIIYISCNPFTQERDIKFLRNYKIESITPVDLFPQTNHVETIVMMSKVAPNK